MRVIRLATSAADLAATRNLFENYAKSLEIDLAFQGFAEEVACLPGRYAPPGGALFLAANAEQHAIGCVGVRPLDRRGCCEMKRLYVLPAMRGAGFGRALAEQAMRFACHAGYEDLFLDTLDSMGGAQALYLSLGFERIPAYDDNPVPHVLYFRKQLHPQLLQGA